MKLSEMQSQLENLQNDLSIISETTTAIETSLDEGVLTSGQLGWALIGVIRNIEKAVDDSGKLVEAMIKIRSTVEGL